MVGNPDTVIPLGSENTLNETMLACNVLHMQTQQPIRDGLPIARRLLSSSLYHRLVL